MKTNMHKTRGAGSAISRAAELPTLVPSTDRLGLRHSLVAPVADPPTNFEFRISNSSSQPITVLSVVKRLPSLVEHRPIACR